MNIYKVERNEEKGGYEINCYDEFSKYSYTFDLLFHDEDEAGVFATILNEETEEAYKNGQISTI
ncbi:hypothetical protein [Oceanobacillus sp. FSL H7-0719]|uniref:hypothetical protein n=1 Tax=Oceanobacillus sp. FSL H7-0719 TaxID=2954507 RepID=UPI0032544796